MKKHIRFVVTLMVIFLAVNVVRAEYESARIVKDDKGNPQLMIRPVVNPTPPTRRATLKSSDKKSKKKVSKTSSKKSSTEVAKGRYTYVLNSGKRQYFPLSVFRDANGKEMPARTTDVGLFVTQVKNSPFRVSLAINEQTKSGVLVKLNPDTKIGRDQSGNWYLFGCPNRNGKSYYNRLIVFNRRPSEEAVQPPAKVIYGDKNPWPIAHERPLEPRKKEMVVYTSRIPDVVAYKPCEPKLDVKVVNEKLPPVPVYTPHYEVTVVQQTQEFYCEEYSVPVTVYTGPVPVGSPKLASARPRGGVEFAPDCGRKR